MQENLGLVDSLLRIGQDIELQPVGSPLPRLASIRKVTNDAIIVELSMPFEAHDNIREGQKFNCKLSSQGCLYKFQSTLQNTPGDTSICWFLDKPQSMTKVQLRRFVRVPLTGRMSWQTFSSMDKDQVPYAGRLVDISGGGLCFRTSRHLSEGELIQVTIPDMPNLGTFNAYATVERCITEGGDSTDVHYKDEDELFHEDGTPNLEEIFSQIEALLVEEEKKEGKHQQEVSTTTTYRVACTLNLMAPPEREQLVSSIFELQRHYIQQENHQPPNGALAS